MGDHGHKERRQYRLPAYPKRTIREKQGCHGDLSISKIDYTPGERAYYASKLTQKNRRIKEGMDAWEKRSCKEHECFAIKEYKGDKPVTCRWFDTCSWWNYYRYG